MPAVLVLVANVGSLACFNSRNYIVNLLARRGYMSAVVETRGTIRKQFKRNGSNRAQSEGHCGNWLNQPGAFLCWFAIGLAVVRDAGFWVLTYARWSEVWNGLSLLLPAQLLAAALIALAYGNLR